MIKASIDASKDFPNAIIASGCGTDHLNDNITIDDVIRAYEEQMEFIENAGGRMWFEKHKQIY